MAAVVAQKVKKNRSSTRFRGADGESNTLQLEIDQHGKLRQVGGKVLDDDTEAESVVDMRTRIKYDYYKKVSGSGEGERKNGSSGISLFFQVTRLFRMVTSRVVEAVILSGRS